jgi:hypothetical protein
MNYWAGLHGDKDAADIQAGADNLMRLASVGIELVLEMLALVICFALRARNLKKTMMLGTLLDALRVNDL